MKKMVQLLLVIGLIMLTILPIFAGGKGEDVEEKKEITVWIKKNLAGVQDKMQSERLIEIGNEMGITVIPVIIPTQDLNSKLNVAIEAKTVPDIVTLTVTLLPLFRTNGILEPLGDVIDNVQSEYGVKFTDSLSAVKAFDKYWAVPYFDGSEVLYIRTDYVKQAGLSSYPKTWDEFEYYIKTITEKVDGVYGYGEAFGNCDDPEKHLNSFLFSNESGLWDKNGKPAFNTPKNIELVRKFTNFYLNGWVPPSAAGWDNGGNNASYLSGQSAIVWNTGSIYNVFMNDDNFKEVRENTIIRPVPTGSSGSRRQMATPLTFGMFNFIDEERKALAKEVLKRLYEPEWYNEWILTSIPQGLPVIDSMNDHPVWDNLDYKGFMDSLEGVVTLAYPGESFTPAMGVAFNNLVLANLLQSIVVAGVSVEEAVAKTHDQLVKIYNDHN